MDNKEKIEELKNLSQPLLDWIYQNGCPHDLIIIDIKGITFLNSKYFCPYETRD